jgi:uncharacterized membrane protein YqhA
LKPILRACRYLIVVAVAGCIVMFGVVTLYAAGAAGSMILNVLHGGFSLDDIAHVTVYAFKVLDLFLIGTILYIVALGLAALFLDAEAALPRWFKVRELQDLKLVLAQSIVVVMLVGFLGDALEWETGSDIAFVGGGVAAVIAAIAFMLRSGGSSGNDGRRG